MKLLATTAMVLLSGMILASAAAADDAADVREAVLKLDAAFNAGDVEVISQYIHPERSLFNYQGRILSEGGFNPSILKTEFDEGLKFNWRIRHLGVKVYGNAAVVTGYHVGTITLLDGAVQRGTRRISEFWIKQDGKWMRVHRHASQLEPPVRETIEPQPATNTQ